MMSQYLAPHRPDDFWRLPELIDQAGQLICCGDMATAAEVLCRANSDSLREWREAQTKENKRSVSGRRVLHASRHKLRMPSAVNARKVFERDGWHCRYCGQRIIEQQTRSLLKAAFGKMVVPLKGDDRRHSTIWVMSGSLDHVVPHSHGGQSIDSNLVTACNVCQHLRLDRTLEEANIQVPRDDSILRNSWDGLRRIRGRVGKNRAIIAARSR